MDVVKEEEEGKGIIERMEERNNRCKDQDWQAAEGNDRNGRLIVKDS